MAVEIVIEREIWVKDEYDTEERVKKQCESFFAVKGAALVLPRSNESRPIKKNPIVGELSNHLQSMFLLLRSVDRMTLAVRLESMHDEHVRYIILVSCNGVQDTEETIIIGVDIISNSASIGLVLPIYCETGIQLDGDGGFSVCTKNHTHTFKPVSVQALWSAMQAVHSGLSTAQKYNYFAGGLHLTWIGYYESRVHTDTLRIKEWHLMPELEVTQPHDFAPLFAGDGHYCPSDRELTEQLIYLKIKDVLASQDLDNITCLQVRLKLEEEIGKNLKAYRHYIDEQLIIYLRQLDSASLIFDHLYLGSEWNASHLAELEANGVGYILNITMEIDNFYPNRFVYHNVRLYDIESSELLKYWDETYKFLSKAKETGSKALVHCKMGISRSAATVIAYAMKEYNWPLEKARNYVRSKRRCVNPNEGFIKQLQVYEGMLDASRQRHNKLWRSKSESALSSSTECSQETSESASSKEDLCDLPNTTASVQQGHTQEAPVLSPGLGLQLGPARRRSWSPKDSVADAYFPHDKPSTHIEIDFMRMDSSDADDCKEIQIVVPEILSPSSPTQSLPSDQQLFTQANLSESSRLSESLSVAQPSLVPPELEIGGATLLVGESPSGFKEGIPEMTSTPIEGDNVNSKESSAPCETSTNSESGLNTNNNSATIEPQLINDIPPVEGTVKLRVNSFENQQVAPEAEVEECTSTAESAVMEEEVPVSSGTVQKQKQDIEDRLKAKAAEKGSPPLTRSGKVSPDTITQSIKESTTSERSELVLIDQPKLAESQDLLKPNTATIKTPLPSASCLLQEMPAASPTLQALEIGRIKKITEQLLSQKSPTKDLEDMGEKQSPLADKRRSWNFECSSPPPDQQTKFQLQKSSPVSSRHSMVLETKEELGLCSPSSKVVDGASQAQSLSDDSDESPRKEPFLRTFFGEDIPLEPGIVKRQADGFEQLSTQEQLEESDQKKEAEIRKIPQEDTLPDEKEMVVIIRESSGKNIKRKFEDDPSQNKHIRVEQSEEDVDKDAEGSEERMKTEEMVGDSEVVDSAYPEEGSTWKVGDVKRHTQQFEDLSVANDDSDPIDADSYSEEGILMKDIPAQNPVSGTGLSLETAEGVVEEAVHVEQEALDLSSEAMEKQKIKEVEGLRERIEKLGFTNLRRTASIARISNERGSPVVLRRKDFSRPVSIRGNRPRSDSGTQSLNSSPDNSTQLSEKALTVEEKRKSAHAKFFTPHVDAVPLEFFLEKPSSVEIRNLSDQPKEPVNTEQGTSLEQSAKGTDEKVTASDKTEQNSPAKGTDENERGDQDSIGALPTVTSLSSPFGGTKKQHGKSHPLSKLSPASSKHPFYSTM
ncbi:uncharacterized protein [Asterias amurensis]|uniref:uncharacterized protein isoform X2 n=1 Tax=Asterias amurensis TaxID=7602 RepID=UPI003AB30075